MPDRNSYSAVILAAGSSSRLGFPKQLIKYNNEFILENLYNNLASITDFVHVITGCYHKEISEQFPNMNLIFNKDWQQGIGSSISLATEHLKRTSHLLLCVCDQALIKKQHYQQLIERSNNSPHSITASYYEKTLGVPAIFPFEYFEELKQLKKSKKGAKKLIQNHTGNIIKVNCPQAQFDLDTKENLEFLMNKLT